MYILRYTLGQFAEHTELFDSFLAAVRYKRSLAQYAEDGRLYFECYIETVEE